MRKEFFTKTATYMVIFIFLFAMPGMTAFADPGSGTVSNLSASYSSATGKVSVTGSASGVNTSLVAVELIKPDGKLLYFGTEKVTGDDPGSFSSVITVGTLGSGTYTVRAADYEGGLYAAAEFTVRSSGGSGGGGGSSAGDVIPPAVTPPSSDPGKYYSDIPASYAWAAMAINGLTEQGVVSGIGEKAFGPANNIRRGDFVLILVKAYGFSADSCGNFADVPAGSYYAEAISAAKAIALASGDGMRFYPQDSLIRQDAMVLLYRAMTLKGITLGAGAASDLSGFADAGQVADYAQTAIAALVKAGIVKGDGGKLNPHASITRAEMAVMLYQALQIK